MLGRIRFRLLPDMRPQTGSMSVPSWRNLGMAVRAGGSQKNLFSSGAPKANGREPCATNPACWPPCNHGAVQAWFDCQNAHHGLGSTAAAYLHNQGPTGDIPRPERSAFNQNPREAEPRETRPPRPWQDHNAPAPRLPFGLLSWQGFAPIAGSRASSEQEMTLSHVRNFREQAAHPIRPRGLNRDLERDDFPERATPVSQWRPASPSDRRAPLGKKRRLVVRLAERVEGLLRHEITG
jgi:hypothetical protein